MNRTTIILIVVIILVVILFAMNQNSNTENFTPDEALQNISSLYNQSKMTVTDFASTGTITSNNANITNGTVANLTTTKATVGTMTAGSGTFTSLASSGSLLSGTTAVNGNLSTLGISANGDVSVSGVINPIGGMQAIVIDAPTWDRAAFVTQIKAYFSRSMPDGTMKHVIFVNPSKSNPSNVWHGLGLKLGQQVLLYEIQPTHTGVNNLWTTTSNDLTNRGNI